MSKFVYMDHSATTALSKEVLSSMMPYLTENYGNPSSIYSIGRKNRAAIEEARKTVADCLKCSEKEVFFTASGTESDNWAIRGVAKALSIKGKHIITSAIEHPAILETCKDMEKQGYEVIGLTGKMVNSGAADLVCKNARSVADKLGIEHYVFDATNIFKREILICCCFSIALVNASSRFRSLFSI